MSKICLKCGRHHNGVCGIPGNGVKVGAGTTGVRAVGRRTSVSDSYSIPVEPKKPRQRTRLTKHGLEELLDWGYNEQQKCLDMLKTLPHDLPEYTQLLEEHDKLTTFIHQLKVQLAAKE